MPRPGPSILRTPASSTGRARRRLGSVADELLGADFGGTLVTDFYAAYDHFEGTKQRCWAYRGPDAVRGPAGMWRDIDALEREEPGDEDLGAWVAGVKAISEAATGPRPAAEQGHTPEAARDRRQRAHRAEQ